MNLKTYRARTMQEALALVRGDLGPTASVLRTRQVRGGGLLRWLSGSRMIEVVASTSISVPSRLPPRPSTFTLAPKTEPQSRVSMLPRTAVAPVQTAAPPQRSAGHVDDLHAQLHQLQSQVADLCRRTNQAPRAEMPDTLFRLYAELIEAEVSEEVARELID